MIAPSFGRWNRRILRWHQGRGWHGSNRVLESSRIHVVDGAIIPIQNVRLEESGPVRIHILGRPPVLGVWARLDGWTMEVEHGRQLFGERCALPTHAIGESTALSVGILRDPTVCLIE